MAGIKEYYPALTIDEYELGEFYMFIKNNNLKSKEIDKDRKNASDHDLYWNRRKWICLCGECK